MYRFTSRSACLELLLPAMLCLAFIGFGPAISAAGDLAAKSTTMITKLDCQAGQPTACKRKGTVAYASLDRKSAGLVDRVLALAADEPGAQKQEPQHIKCTTSSYPGTGVFNATCTLCYGADGGNCCTCSVDSHGPGGCSGEAC